MDKVLHYTARALSGLTFPLLMPTWGVLVAFMTTYLAFLPAAAMIGVLFVTFGLTVMLPVIVIFVMMRLGRITDPLLNNQQERTIPLLTAIPCYLAVAAYLFVARAPLWMTLFMVGGAVAIAVIAVINRRWKISGHSAGMGGLTALAVFLTMRGYEILPGALLPLLMILLSGMVGTARLLLERHTLGQVAAGYALGFTIIYLSTIFS